MYALCSMHLNVTMGVSTLVHELCTPNTVHVSMLLCKLLVCYPYVYNVRMYICIILYACMMKLL